MGIEAINAFELPLLNTVLLLASGVTITYSHHSLIQGNRNGALYGAMFTIVLALVFTAFQGVEYSVSSFTLTDGAFGSCFYFGTGFHGLHVIIGTMFIDDLEEEDVNLNGWDCATNVLIQARDDKTRGHNGLAAVIHGRA